MQSIDPPPYGVWVLLFAGPLLFLLGIVAASVLLGAREMAPAAIAERVPLLMPQILLGVLSVLGLLLMLVAGADLPGIWAWPGAHTVKHALVGAGAGALLALAYVGWLGDAIVRWQQRFGDYVPPGSVLPTLSGSIGVFFLANVLLAPLVEETLYRGYALPLLSDRFGMAAGIALSSVCFGLLHWAGGIWYVLVTAIIAGGLFAALHAWSGSVWAPYAAHLMLNVIEFHHAWRSSATAMNGGAGG